MNRNFNTEGFGKDLYALVDQGEISDTVNDSQDALASKEFPEVEIQLCSSRTRSRIIMRLILRWRMSEELLRNA